MNTAGVEARSGRAVIVHTAGELFCVITGVRAPLWTCEQLGGRAKTAEPVVVSRKVVGCSKVLGVAWCSEHQTCRQQAHRQPRRKQLKTFPWSRGHTPRSTAITERRISRTGSNTSQLASASAMFCLRNEPKLIQVGLHSSDGVAGLTQLADNPGKGVS